MSARLILGFFVFLITIFAIGAFILQVKEESMQMEMAKIGLCKYRQGFEAPAYYKCKEHP